MRNDEPARTRFFTDSVQTGCGTATSAVGPFYCPRDRYAYIDLGFFEDLQSQLGARGGPLAEAYVLAHEYGHHIQNLTGTLGSANRDTGPQGGQVRLELQADCYAGVWGHSAYATGKVAPGEISDALDAAGAVGDDRIQKMQRGTVRPESFTHGSSADRQRWFKRGMDSGDEAACDTF